jgi:hypothetical protein
MTFPGGRCAADTLQDRNIGVNSSVSHLPWLANVNERAAQVEDRARRSKVRR